MDAEELELPAGGGRRHAEALAAHHGFVRALARGLVAPSAADDVAQEALLAGLRTGPDRPGALRSWLATSVRNIASKWRRGEQRQRAREAIAAPREALPSARELVERIELAQKVVQAVMALREPERTALLWRFYEERSTAEIAERLGVPADTVRARLRRGLEEVRRRLDGSYGERGAWLGLLAPMAGLPPAAVGTIVATGAVTGAVAMTAKAVAALVVISATAGLAWLVVPQRFIDRMIGAPVQLATRERPQGAAIGDAFAVGDAARGETPQAARVAESGAAAGGTDAASAAVALPPPGHVAFHVVDARGQPLEDVRVRFLREQRFAEYHGAGDVTACLTAGAWDANVTAPGYDPMPLAGFEVRVGETTKLGTLALSPGGGVIEGHVVARHLASETVVDVQLWGDGRAHCDLCRPRPDVEAPENCECGFKPEMSELALTGDRRFRFGHLAAGVYWLRAFDPEQRIVSAQRIELARGGTAWQELDVTTPTLAKFELRHEHGGLFTGDWANVHRDVPQPIHFSFRRAGKVVGEVQITPTVDDVLATMGAPLLPQGRAGAGDQSGGDLAGWDRSVQIDLTQALSFSFSNMSVDDQGHVVFGNAAGAEERLDRERQEGDELGFDCAEPDVSGAQLAIEKLRADQFQVKPLPRADLTVVVTCGNYTSDELPVDLRAEQFAPLVVTLLPSTAWNEQLKAIALGPPKSCAACHGDGEPIVAPAPPPFVIELGGGDGQGAGIQLFRALEGLKLPAPEPASPPDHR